MFFILNKIISLLVITKNRVFTNKTLFPFWFFFLKKKEDQNSFIGGLFNNAKEPFFTLFLLEKASKKN